MKNLDSSFYPGGDFGSAFVNREIKDHIPGDITKEITERVPVCSLITERCSVDRRFFAAGGAEGDVNKHYSMIRVAKRVELCGTTRLGDGGETEIKKVNLTVLVIGETCRKVNHFCGGLSN